MSEIQHLENTLSMYISNPIFWRNPGVHYTPPQFPLHDQEKSFKQGLLEKGTPRGREGVISLVGEPTSATKMEMHNGAAAWQAQIGHEVVSISLCFQ